MAIFGANVNLKRHICEIKDGLKPVHRRILYTMYLDKLMPSKETKKSATVVGDVLKIHPHGDASAYKSMVYLGQPWRNNVTLVDGSSSNFGSAYNPEGFAHYRYTNCKLSKFAYDCFFSEWRPTSNDMTVDWTPTFDEKSFEPMYLPSKYPLFLLRWHKAMGLGRYTSTLGFNTTEAFNAVIELIKNPDANFEMYPDDPSGCMIINKKDLKGILDKESVTVKMRATYKVNHYNGKDVIEIENCPFEVSPKTVTEAITELCIKGQLPEISDIEGSSINLGKGFRISIELKKGYDAHAVMTKLFRKTQLEETFTTKYSFVNGLESVDYTLRIAILEWIRYRRETLKRMHKIRQVTILKRMHFLEPLIMVLQSGEIDEFIKIIRKNKRSDAVKKIMKTFNMTDYQADKIADVKLSDLSMDSLDKYIEELKTISAEERELNEIAKSKKKIDKIIIKQMEEGIEKYGTERRTRITQLIDNIKIPDTLHYLIFTNKYVKKLPFDDSGYRVGRVDNGEKVLKVMTVNNRDKIAIFTSDGKVLPIEVNDIGNSSLQSVGIAYSQLGAKDNFVEAIKINDEDSNKYIATVTAKGMISKTSYEELIDKKKLFAFMKLGTNDRVTGMCICTPKSDLMVYTLNGEGAKFAFDDFETTAKNTKGVISAKLTDDDSVMGVININPDDELLVTLTDRGYMKRFPIKLMPQTKRNGKTIEIQNGNGDLIKVKAIKSTDEVMHICTTVGAFEINPMLIKAKSRIGKNQRVVELKASDYAFNIIDI
jgi:DNA gyrase subunit A